MLLDCFGCVIGLQPMFQRVLREGGATELAPTG
jgi:hypothetical protein